jgi:hypothetical protein
MSRGGHGLPNVSLGPTMPDPSTPCGRATPETALQSFYGWSAHKVGGLWQFSTPLDSPMDTPCSTPTPTQSSSISASKSRVRAKDEGTTPDPSDIRLAVMTKGFDFRI